MGFKNIKANQGFTIVELLIVVVVIAILAAITIVSYNGITKQANASAAKSTAASLQKKVELYFAEKSTYPLTTNLLTGAAGKPYEVSTSIFPGGLNATALSSDNGKNSARLYVCHAGASGTVTSTNIAGAYIAYWDYEAGTPAETTKANSIKLGDTTTCNIAAAS